MSNWKPKWKSDTDPKPKEVSYEWLDENTGETLFNVTVTAGGLVYVLEDDWLSKYTKAIYGDFDTYARFIRINPAEKSFSIIENVDLIYAGETLLHIESYLAFVEWLKNLGDIANDFALIPQELHGDMQSLFNWTTGAAALDAIGWLIELASIEAAVAETAIVAGGVVLLTVAALAAGSISAVMDIIDANNPEIATEQIYAVIYTTTAWFFDETSETTTYPTTDKNLGKINGLGEINPYIPQLPYTVPQGVANPASWRHIHKLYLLGVMDKDAILFKLDRLRDAWQDTATKTIERLLSLYEDAVLSGGNPNLTLKQYKNQYRTVMLPGKTPRLLGKSEFFKLVKDQTYKTFLNKWWGPTITLNKILSPEYDTYYPVPK